MEKNYIFVCFMYSFVCISFCLPQFFFICLVKWKLQWMFKPHASCTSGLKNMFSLHLITFIFIAATTLMYILIYSLCTCLHIHRCAKITFLFHVYQKKNIGSYILHILISYINISISPLFMKLQYQYLCFKDVISWIIVTTTDSGEVLTWKVELVTISTSAFTQTSPRAPALSHTG